MRKKINPNTFSSKIWLIIIDKLIIGTVIALALIWYDNLKTKEIRKYNESREEIQYNFKRAEYIKTLVPIVLDDKKEIMYRAYTLRSLLSTGAIDKRVAVSFAQVLLSSDLLSFNERKISTINMSTKKILTFKPSSLPTHLFFHDLVMETMPEGLPTLIDECIKLKERAQWLPNNVDEMSDEMFNQDRISRDSLAFWKNVFIETLNKYDDKELRALNHYSLGELLVFSELFDKSDQAEYFKWISRELIFPKIIAYIKLVEIDNEIAPQAGKYFLELFKSKESDSRYYEFMNFFLFYLRAKNFINSEIGYYLQSKIKELEGYSTPQSTPVDGNNRSQFIMAAKDYVNKITKTSATSGIKK